MTWWPEGPLGVVRVGVVFLVAVATLGVAVRYVSVLRDSDSAASRDAALSFSDREIAGGNGLVADQIAAYAARALIPADAPYHVAVDPGFSGGNAETVDHVAAYYRYFLMPRRPVEDAKWIVCYGCKVSEYGSDVRVLWRDEDGISILRRGE